MSNHVVTPDKAVQVLQMAERAQALQMSINDLIETAITAGGPESTLAQQIEPTDDELIKLRLEISKICIPEGTIGAAYAQTLISQLESMSKSWLLLFEQFRALRDNSQRIISHIGKTAVEHGGMTREELAKLLKEAKMDNPGRLSEGSE